MDPVSKRLAERQSVECPTCYADPGDPCRTADGIETEPHAQRRPVETVYNAFDEW